MDSEVLLIVNPRSGVDKNKDSIIESAARLCERQGLRFNLEFTSKAGDAAGFARKGAEEGFAKVLVAGGDGTVKDAADGLWGSDTALGILPMGSGNGLARSLGIPQEGEKALHVALGPGTVSIDRGIADGKTFYSAFGVGFDAEVSFQFSQDKRRGRTTYIKHAVRELFTYRPRKFVLEIDGIEIPTEALLIAVCNCKQYGNNAYIAPKADPTDGFLDVTVVHKGNFFSETLAGLELFSGTLDRNILVKIFRTESLVIKGAGPTMTHTDGEPAEMGASIPIICEKKGLNVMIPETTEPFRPIFTPMKSIWEDMIADLRKSIDRI